MRSVSAVTCVACTRHTRSYTVTIHTSLAGRRLPLRRHSFPHLPLHSRNRTHSTIHHRGVDLAHARARIEDLQALLAIGDAAGGEYDFGLEVFML